MAEVAFTHVPAYVGAGVYRTIWAGLSSTDVSGVALTRPALSDRSVQVTGTPAGCTITLQGCNEEVPTNWETLHDSVGDPIALTAGGLRFITENTNHIRPLITGATGSTDITVIVVGRAT